MADLAVLFGGVGVGRRRGRVLGFPTANVELEGPLPADLEGAVYAGRVKWDGSPGHDAVVNIGARPTFAEGGCSVEVHLLGFSGDLYGRRLEVRLLERLRPEQRFDSAEALISQIRRDIDQARAVLEREAQRP